MTNFFFRVVNRYLVIELLLLSTFFSSFGADYNAGNWRTVVYATDTWRYFEGLSQPPASWIQTDFDDSSWKTGKGGFGFGDNDDNTIVSNVLSVYIRKTFSIGSTEQIGAALLHIDYDDGFIAYLNGVEIARKGLSELFPAYNSVASINHEAVMYSGGTPEAFSIDGSLLKNIIKTGDNILAIEVHNNSSSSSDLSVLPFLSVELNGSSVTYGDPPSWFSAPFSFSSSNLPIILIETVNGATISDEPKTDASMKIIDNGQGQRNYLTDTPTGYDGSIGIEIRGRYSASLPQKPYGIETRDLNGENANVKLLGMPKENDWILLANYNDKSFMRNTLAFHLFEKMGHYAPKSRACEVLLNGKYQGIYIFTEKIKQDKNRVAIAKLETDDNAGDSVTGGYIFKIDYPDEGYWTGSYPPFDTKSGQVNYVYHDPATDELTASQKKYIKDFVYAFETALLNPALNNTPSGYRAFIDVESFIDYMIIGEVSRNVDAYKKSRFLYKDRESRIGLLKSGPVWDMDWSMKNINDCVFLSTLNGSGWAYKINNCNVRPVAPAWEVQLMQDQLFANQFYTRYADLRKTILSDAYLAHYADSVENLLMEAQVRHYQAWPILGKNVGAPEKDAIPTTYQGEVDKLVKWLNVRLNWLDKNIKGTYLSHDVQTIRPTCLRVFPNPARSNLNIESDLPIQEIMFFRTNGSLVKTIAGRDQLSVQTLVNDLPSGIFMLKVVRNDQSTLTSHILIKR